MKPRSSGFHVGKDRAGGWPEAGAPGQRRANLVAHSVGLVAKPSHGEAEQEKTLVLDPVLPLQIVVTLVHQFVPFA